MLPCKCKAMGIITGRHRQAHRRGMAQQSGCHSARESEYQSPQRACRTAFGRQYDNGDEGLIRAPYAAYQPLRCREAAASRRELLREDAAWGGCRQSPNGPEGGSRHSQRRALCRKWVYHSSGRLPSQRWQGLARLSILRSLTVLTTVLWRWDGTATA